MKPKISLDNRYLLKPWTYVLNVVLLYYLIFYSVSCFPLISFFRQRATKSQSGQINHHNNKYSSSYNHNLNRDIYKTNVDNRGSSKIIDFNNNSTNKDKSDQNHSKLENQVSFVDWFISREVDSLMHDSITADTAKLSKAKLSESTYGTKICSIDYRLEGNGVSEKLDKLVNKFEDVALKDNSKIAEKLRVGLAEAIELDEIIDEKDHNNFKNDESENLRKLIEDNKNDKQPTNSHKKKISPSKGLMDLLDEINPNIVHRKVLGGKSIKKLIAFAMNQPKYSDKVILSKMFAHVLQNTLERDKRKQQNVENPITGKLSDNDSNPVVTASTTSDSTNTNCCLKSNDHQSTKIKRVTKVAGTAISIALFVFEELYLSPSFLEHLPVIGAGIRKLKKFGQSPYDIIQAVRSVHDFLIHYKEAPGDDPILKVSHIMKKNNAMMFSQKGVDSLSRIATKLVESNRKRQAMTPADKKEIAGRSAFYFLINFATGLGGCKLSAKAYNTN